MNRPLNVMHIIAGLETGGAETMLMRLIEATEGAVLRNTVISLTDIGATGRNIQALGVPVGAIGMTRGIPNPAAIVSVARQIMREKPDVIQTWMYHADLLGGIAARCVRERRVVWGVHNTTLDPRYSKRTTIWTARMCALVSPLIPAAIVCCAEETRRLHRTLGYSAEKLRVIPNGFDVRQFSPDHVRGRSVRRELGIPQSATVVASIGRFDPQKDHANFCHAAGLVQTTLLGVHFVLCGEGLTDSNQELARWISENNVCNCHLLGRRDDVARLLNGIDVLVTSSAYGEAFPLVIGEAMASGVPCVVTDVGDSASMVAHTGQVVASRDSKALARGIIAILKLPPESRQHLGEQARQRVTEKYSLEAVVRRYHALYEEVASIGSAIACNSRCHDPSDRIGSVTHVPLPHDSSGDPLEGCRNY